MEGIDFTSFDGNPMVAPLRGLLQGLVAEIDQGKARTERQADVWVELTQAVRELTVAVRALTEGKMQEAVKAALLQMAVGEPPPDADDALRWHIEHGDHK